MPCIVANHFDGDADSYALIILFSPHSKRGWPAFSTNSSSAVSGDLFQVHKFIIISLALYYPNDALRVARLNDFRLVHGGIQDSAQFTEI